MSIIGTALSGMRASEARLTASASNVANSGNIGPIAAPATFGPTGDRAGKAQEESPLYRPLRTQQTSAAGGGVIARTASASQPYTLRYQPDAPGADANGMVAAPNVELSQEAAEQLDAVQAFKANAKVAATALSLSRSTLEIWG